MKTKIIFGLVVLSLCFACGGFYITDAMNKVVSGLQDLLVLQSMGFQRKNLVAQIKELQADLLLMDTPHATNYPTLVRHSMEVKSTISSCDQCHHPSSRVKSMLELHDQVDTYLKQINEVYAPAVPKDQTNKDKSRAFDEGNRLLNQVSDMFIHAEDKIATRTAQARQSVASTRELLIYFIIIGPLFILIVAITFLIRFTHAITILGKAIGSMKNGDLEYRITEPLRDEFQDLAMAFNDMVISLCEQRQQVENIQQRYRILFESAGDAIFILEAEGANAGKILSANKAAADIHGYSLEELLQMSIYDLDVCEDKAKSIPARFQRILEGAWVKDMVKHGRKDGTIFPVEASAGLMEYGEHRYILAFDRDVTKRIQTEEALQRSKQLAMVGTMAAGLVHEIKNPLAGIKVSMEVLSSELKLEAEDREVMLQVVNEVNRIEALLRNVLGYARPPRPEFCTCDVRMLLENSVKSAELSLKSPSYLNTNAGSINFALGVEDPLPLIRADYSKLLQVFLNLFLNAIEASPEGGTILVNARRIEDRNTVEIMVADSGKGLSTESLAKIFQPFFTTKPKGTGLGLAISKRLIEQHNGTIEANSILGQGTTFTLTLPLEQNA